MNEQVIVDHQTHWVAPEFLESLTGRRTLPRAERQKDGYRLETCDGGSWWMSPRHIDLDIHLRDMDAHGVGVMVSSPPIVGELAGMRGSELHEAAEHLNDAAARAQREHPERFVGLAVLAMQEPDIAVRVLDRAIGELGLRGVCIYSNIDGASIAAPELLPIYRRIEQLNVPIVLHPASRSVLYDAERPGVVERGLNWMCDSSLAALSLIYCGVLDACPSLTVLHPHLGGVLPYVAGRLAASARVMEIETRPLQHYLRRHFYTDAAADTPGAFGLAAETYGEDRILFATDFPWQDRAGTFELLQEQDGRSLDRASVLSNRLPRLP